MTRLLDTPADWPRILLARADAPDDAPDLGPETGHNLERALSLGAFGGLQRAIDEFGPDGIITEAARAKLRGRGGAGHFASAKWRRARDTEATRSRYVKTKPVPFPPEPLRTAIIQLTRNRLAAADQNDGRRGLWLRRLEGMPS